MNGDGSGRNADRGDWSPDRHHLAFASRRDANFEIYVLNADGTGQTDLPTTRRVTEEPIGVVGARPFGKRRERLQA